jgi:hypothetical protein
MWIHVKSRVVGDLSKGMRVFPIATMSAQAPPARADVALEKPCCLRAKPRRENA